MAKERPPRKHLGVDALYRQIYQVFQNVPDYRGTDSPALANALMSGFAVFALKDPSLLAFDQRRQQDAKNLEMIFHIGHVPCDTQMRETLDPVDPEEVRPAFCNIFAELAHGKVLEKMVFLDDCYLLALDGTECFSSTQVHCDHCLHKKLSNVSSRLSSCPAGGCIGVPRPAGSDPPHARTDPQWRRPRQERLRA